LKSFLTKIIKLLDKQEKSKVFSLVIFSIFISLIETIGVSAIMPFIDVATNLDVVNSNPIYSSIYDYFNLNSQLDFLQIFGYGLIFFYIFRGLVNIYFNHLSVSFSSKLFENFSKKLLAVYGDLPYSTFSEKNSSDFSKNIITEGVLAANVFSALLLIISEIFVLVFIYLVMLFVNLKITIALTFFLLIKIIFLSKTITPRIKKMGMLRAEAHKEMYSFLSNFFSNFKFLKLKTRNTQNYFKSLFEGFTSSYVRATIVNGSLAIVPRLFLETGTFVLAVLFVVVYIDISEGSLSDILPTVSLFLVSLYRLMPSINRIITNYNKINFHFKSIDILDGELDLKRENLGKSEVLFNNSIELVNICFSYNQKEFLSGINLRIDKGDFIGFIGPSGSGKTTIVDLISGLLFPDQGNIMIDNKPLSISNIHNWRAKIGYIPQNVFLFNGSVQDNICFGSPYDIVKLNRVVKQANIQGFLMEKDGLKTIVGDGGIQLSGGQKQRIAIARALYSDPEILILDEATSALDTNTEKKIIEEIYDLSSNKTLIIIAHRLSTLYKCNKVYKVIDNKVVVSEI